MYKNKIVLTLALGLLLSPLFALQAASTTSNPPTFKTDEEKMIEMKAKLMKETAIIKKNMETSNVETKKILSETKNTNKIKLDISKQDKVRSLLNNIYSKLNTQIGKLSQVNTKISAKIDRAEKAGSDVIKIKEQYTVAKTALDKATADVLSTRMQSSEQTYIETSKEAFRVLVKTAEESIKTAGVEYQKLIPLLAKINAEIKKVESTTNTVTQ